MLTSSAIGGRKAPPKAPPRRRNAQQSTSNTAPPEQSNQDAESGEAIQVLPSTEQSAIPTDAPIQEVRLPSPPVMVERPVADMGERDLQTQPPAVRTSIEQIQEASEVEERGNVAAVQGDSTSQVAESIINASEPRQTRKRGAPTAVARRTRKRLRTEESAQVENEETTTSTTGQQIASNDETTTTTSAPNKRRPARSNRRKRSQAQSLPQEEGDDQQAVAASQSAHAEPGSATTDAALNLSERTVPPTRNARTRKARLSRARVSSQDEGEEPVEENGENEESGSDPEEHQIDPSTLSMFDLSHDARHGRVSAREKKMAKIDWNAVAERRRAEADAIQRGDRRREQDNEPIPTIDGEDLANDQQDGDDRNAAQAGAPARPLPITRASTGGVRFRIVGGQIVEDETSLTIDRAARIEETINDTADQPAQEEENLTFRLNRTTYMNDRRRDETERVPNFRRKSDAWSEEETDRFYDALRHFGTDFFIISKMFPPKTRRHIKMKFVREERLEPDRINAVLLGQADPRNRINLAEYAQAIDRDVNDFHKYDSLEHANEVIKASMKDKEEEMRAAVKQEEESVRQRELQKQQREKQRLEMEKKRDERNRKKQLKRRGEIYSTGTFGAADDDDFGSFARPTLPDFDEND
ncbi:hypothetical protein MRB53_037962 [Persea americana]|nr:hypothetical protein MRB53_037962 [Persea americana]